MIGVKSRFCCIGRIYVLALPTRDFSMEGDERVVDESCSSDLELGLHLKNWNPPPPCKVGKCLYSRSLKSVAESVKLENSISFSPSPAVSNLSFSWSVVGIRSCLQLAKQMNLCFQMHFETVTLFFLLPKSEETSSLALYLFPNRLRFQLPHGMNTSASS